MTRAATAEAIPLHPPLIADRNCLACGIYLFGRNLGAKTCSPKCRKRLQRLRSEVPLAALALKVPPTARPRLRGA